MDRINAAVFEFGEFRLDTAERVLRRNGTVVSLTPKAVSMLELLVSREGTVVSRSEISEELWPDTFVEEANLTVTISMLRKALGESYIRTIPKRGYAFAVPVRRIDLQPVNDNSAAPPPPPTAIPSAPVSTYSKTPRRLLLIASLPVLAVAITLAAWLIFRSASNKTAKPKDFMAITPTRLSDSGNIQDVTISPDGNRLAFVPIEAGQQGLRIRDLTTNHQIQLLERQERLCWGLRFAHDGQNLYYHTTEPNSTISVLYRINARGGEPPHKISVNVDSEISLSPDGSQIAFIRSFPGRHYDALVIANNDGTGEHELSTLQHPQKFSFSGLAWSPDGKTIALGVSENNGVSFNIKAVPLLGGEMQTLTSQSWNAMRGFGWSDDGSTLIFSASTKESPATQVWQLESKSGGIHRVTNDVNYYEGVHLTKTGKIVTMQVAEIGSLWIVDPTATPAERKLTFGTKEGESGVVALPNGNVVYTIEANGKPNLWSVNRDGNSAVQLTNGGASTPCATADGKYVVYSSLRTGVRHLYRLDLVTRQEVQLTNGGGENHPGCTSDGRWVVYTALADARNTLWRVSMDGGAPQQLTKGSIIVRPVVSPDGKSIACAFRKDEADKWKIAILPFGGGDPIQVLNIPKPFNQIVRWTSDSNALFYLVEKDGATNIWKQPLDGSPPEQITQFTEDGIYHYDRFGVSESFVLARGRVMRDIVLISNP